MSDQVPASDDRPSPIARAPSLLWIPYLVGGVGAVSGAWLSSVLIHRGTGLDRARKAVLIPSAALGSLGVFSYFALDYAAVLLLAAGRIEQIRPPLVAGPPKLAIRGATGDHIA
jgi:hypothetical protein